MAHKQTLRMQISRAPGFTGLFKLFILLWTSLAALSVAAAIPKRPVPERLFVNLSREFPDFLSPEESARLEQKLDTFARNTSNQILVLVTDDLDGLEAWAYATEIGQSWGVGQGKFDNGIVVLIKPTGSEGGRDAFIAVGYGLEGAIPDLTARQIVERELIPALSRGRYFEALDNSTSVLMALAAGEYSHKDYGQSRKPKFSRLFFYLIIIIFIIIILSRKNRGGGMTIGRRGTLFGPFQGGFGGFGGGGFGGGSGGGFGGFGGGGFGGGGSGGKW